MRKENHIQDFLKVIQEPGIVTPIALSLLILGKIFSYELLTILGVILGIFSFYSSTRIIHKILVLVLFLIVLIFLNFSYSSNDLKNIEVNSHVCGLVREQTKTRLFLQNTSFDGYPAIPNITIDISKFGKSLSYNELDYICIEISGPAKSYRVNDIIITPDKDITESIKYNSLSDYIRTLKDSLSNLASQNFQENYGLYLGIVFGVRDSMDGETEKSFREAGLSHILVASGANIVLIIKLFESIFRNKNNKFSIIAQFVCVTTYLLIVGLQGSLVRAFMFYIIFLLDNYAKRDIGFIHKISFATLLILIIFPSQIYSYSFILSITAVYSLKISELLSAHFGHGRVFRHITQSVIVVTLTSFMAAYLFSSFNLTGIFSNLVLLPFVEVLVLGGFALTIFIIALGNFGLSLPGTEFYDLLLGGLKSIVDLININIDGALDFYMRPSSSEFMIVAVAVISISILTAYSSFIEKRLSA